MSNHTVLELKDFCRNHDISGYGNKNKEQIITLIKNYGDVIASNPQKYTVEFLKDYCRFMNISGYSNKTKDQILTLIRPPPTQHVSPLGVISPIRTHKNFFTNIDQNLVPMIGNYLNFNESKTTFLIDKNLNKGDILKYRTCIVVDNLKSNYKTLNQFRQYKNIIMNKLDDIYKYKSNPSFLKIYYNLSSNKINTIIDMKEIDPYDFIEQEILELLEKIKQLKSLKALELVFNQSLSDSRDETNEAVYNSLSEIKVEFLSIDFEFYDYNLFFKFIYENPQLSYLELKKSSFRGDNSNFNENKIDTLALLDIDIRSFNFSLNSFVNLRRLILGFIDHVVMKELHFVHNLVALDIYRDFGWEDPNGLEDSNHTLPNSIRFLNIDIGIDSDRKPANLLNKLNNLEYLSLGNVYTIKSLFFISDNNKYNNLKYLYIKNLWLNFYEDDTTIEKEYFDEFVKMILDKKLIYFGFDRAHGNIELLLDLSVYFGWILKKMEKGEYVIDNPRYTPEWWLRSNNFMIRPKCGLSL